MTTIKTIAMTAAAVLMIIPGNEPASEPIAIYEEVEIPEFKQFELIEIGLSPNQEKWIDDLEICESSGIPTRINHLDVDGTASYGAFQFKPGTFKDFAKKYGIKGELMDREAQRAIVVEMVKEADKIKWNRQFPGCVRKLGTPPRS
ncbi:MAG TPA: hypothetical protein VGE62_01140 [Candidatus Paceibacterota bacterium]